MSMVLMSFMQPPSGGLKGAMRALTVPLGHQILYILNISSLTSFTAILKKFPANESI